MNSMSSSRRQVVYKKDESDQGAIQSTLDRSIGPIQNLQTLNGSSFIGTAAEATLLGPPILFQPDAATMHTDGGNTKVSNFSGPLGVDLVVSSFNVTMPLFSWGSDGELTSTYINTINGTTLFGLAAVDPDTLQTTSVWLPPHANQTLNFAYMELLQDTNTIIVSSKQGHIYTIRRNDSCTPPSFTLLENIDLVSSSILSPAKGNLLLTAMQDTNRNIWFLTGGVLGVNEPAQNSTILGYVSPSGSIHSFEIQGQMGENGMAVSGTQVFVVTGPQNSTVDNVGYIYALTASESGIETVWKSEYDAGTQLKPGGSARGSGSTPVLLGDDYVAITDNADSQMHLNVYHQNAQANTDSQLVCSTALFSPGAGANDIGLIANFDPLTSTYGILILNDYNCPPVFINRSPSEELINGALNNNMTVMAPGITRVDVAQNVTDGICPTAWANTTLRNKSIFMLSAKTGLVYMYVQDEELANDGHYEWYVVAVDFGTGEEKWRVRTGAGGLFNDNFGVAALSPNGTYFQSVLGGVITVRDA